MPDARLYLTHAIGVAKFATCEIWPTQAIPVVSSWCALLRPNGVDLRGHIATKEAPRTKSMRLAHQPAHRRLHLLAAQTVAADSKASHGRVSPLEACRHTKGSKDAEAVEGDTLESRRTGAGTVAEQANVFKSTKLANSIKNPELEAFELADAVGLEEVAENPNVSDSIPTAEGPDLQLAGHNPAFTSCKPPQEPLARSSPDYSGFSIDRHGQLRIKSPAAALKKKHTALIVTSVSPNMVEDDFTRLLAQAPNRENDQGGLMQVVPGRDADFNRLSYWILLFDCPYSAAAFQYRLRWYHTNATLNLPINPYTAATMKKRELTPPEGYVDPLSGEDTWKRLHEFSVLMPTQRFSVTAMLEPFPETVRIDLRNHQLWKRPASKSGTWPVRIWIDDYDLRASLVKRFLTADDNERGRRWELVAGIANIEPMLYTAFNGKGDRINREGGQIRKKDLALLHASPQKNWVIRFSTKEGALLFWRTWHRRPSPESLSPAAEGERLLHVDPLW